MISNACNAKTEAILIVNNMPGVPVRVHMVRIRGVQASASDVRLPVTVIAPGCRGSAVPGACPGAGGIRARAAPASARHCVVLSAHLVAAGH